jgi:hypothetical protein
MEGYYHVHKRTTLVHTCAYLAGFENASLSRVAVEHESLISAIGDAVNRFPRERGLNYKYFGTNKPAVSDFRNARW